MIKKKDAQVFFILKQKRIQISFDRRMK